MMGLAAVQGTLTPGAIASFSLLFELVIWPILGLCQQWNRLYEGGGAFRRVLELIDRSPTTVGTYATWSFGNGRQPLLALKGVCYRPSDGENAIIREMEFTLNHGEKLVVVGASGSGKTTFAELCCGLLEPTEGEVRHGHWTARDNDFFLYVAQRPYLFHDTVRDQIRLSIQGTTDAIVQAAARQASIHVEIEQFEQQYDTVIGEHGDNLSGGQKQRLGLARIFASKAEFVILDEPTSALDPRTEHGVIGELKHWLANRTAIIITHRMEVARGEPGQRIIVMEQGRIT